MVLPIVRIEIEGIGSIHFPARAPDLSMPQSRELRREIPVTTAVTRFFRVSFCLLRSELSLDFHTLPASLRRPYKHPPFAPSAQCHYSPGVSPITAHKDNWRLNVTMPVRKVRQLRKQIREQAKPAAPRSRNLSPATALDRTAPRPPETRTHFCDVRPHTPRPERRKETEPQ